MSLLPAPKPETNEELIAGLEYLLECARSGELSALIYATVSNTRTIGTGWFMGTDEFLLTTALTNVTARFYRDVL